MLQEEHSNTIHPHKLKPEKPTIPLAPQTPDVATIPLKSDTREIAHKRLLPDRPIMPLKSLVQEVTHKLLMPDDNTIPLTQAAAKITQEIEVRHNLLMPDTPTLLLKPVADDKSSMTKPDLRQRVIRALNRRKPVAVDKRTTTALPVVKVDVQDEQNEASKPVQPAPDAPDSPFGATYVRERLNRSIHDAQVNQNYNEAIRLQLLAWKMEDKEISPIEVARKAWLLPASEKPAS
jgi:hypothetical protein